MTPQVFDLLAGKWPFAVLEEDGVAPTYRKTVEQEPAPRYIDVEMREAMEITVVFTKLSTEISGKFHHVELKGLVIYSLAKNQSKVRSF